MPVSHKIEHPSAEYNNDASSSFPLYYIVQ